MAADQRMPTHTVYREIDTFALSDMLPSRIKRKQLSKKNNGALHELLFMYECMKRDWKVSIPVGEDCQYDVIVDTPKRLCRVQVKAFKPDKLGRPRFKASYGNKVERTYTYKECDIIAAYVTTLNTWWIIPVKKLKGSCLNLKTGYHEFNSAWSLIADEKRYKKIK